MPATFTRHPSLAGDPVPPQTRQEKNQLIENLLSGLTGLRGVTTAAIVDTDGFVTHIRRDFEMDADALGAAVQIVFTAAQRAAAQVGQTATRLVLVENGDGVVFLAPLSRGFVLAVVADASAMLGAVRYEVKESIPDLDACFAR